MRDELAVHDMLHWAASDDTGDTGSGYHVRSEVGEELLVGEEASEVMGQGDTPGAGERISEARVGRLQRALSH